MDVISSQRLGYSCRFSPTEGMVASPDDEDACGGLLQVVEKSEKHFDHNKLLVKKRYYKETIQVQ